MKKIIIFTFSLMSLLITGNVIYAQTSSKEKPGQLIEKNANPTDVRAQAAEYIGYYHSIKLSPEQEKIKEEALSSIPAPCCSNYSIATCCCPCNMAKSVWGLSHFLIEKRKYNVQQVRKAANEWIQRTNPHGYTGNACYTKGCNRSFEKNGCGGMNESEIL